MKTAFQLKSADGLRLSAQAWIPEPPRGAVCLIHGLGEHGGRYTHVAEALNRSGLAVIALDLRGHGKSEGKRGHSPNYDLLLSDIGRLVQYTATRFPDIPKFLYGHSLGGNLVLHYALKKKPRLSGIVVTAPLFRLAFDPPHWQQLLLKMLNRMNIRIGMPSRINPADLSRDQAVVDAYTADPLNHATITPVLAVEMIEAGLWNLKQAARLSCPTLLIHGDADRITSCEASREFARQAGDPCTLKIWPGLYHEPHHEPEKEQVLETILAWLNQQLMH